MAAVTPADVPLPPFFDPVLAYLSDNLPEPIYSFLLTVLSHILALATALYALVLSLLSTHPLQWDALTILPPLIALLTSYLAILSLYRTTTWMFRMSFWFIKWGTLLGGVVALASWILAQQGGANALAGRGLAATVGSMLLNAMDGDGRNAAGRPRTRSRTTKFKSRTTRPKPWDSFEQHREWQQEQDPNDGDVFDNIMNAAGKAVMENGWWEAAKGFLGKQDESESSTRQNRKEKKTKTR
ncbi:hypothetical protein FB45DRAFT_893644 [Roridomyces roridus]|uniref:Uncharacterized protein n=1 Tax=Roridomyces roridus TaxID=1738132 RepID=A0AAD7CFK4_9AGAR|nr:hypothetical protein FB45DRAFT_893644 [Roridomyces roridus]